MAEEKLRRETEIFEGYTPANDPVRLATYIVTAPRAQGSSGLQSTAEMCFSWFQRFSCAMLIADGDPAEDVEAIDIEVWRTRMVFNTKTNESGNQTKHCGIAQCQACMVE